MSCSENFPVFALNFVVKRDTDGRYIPQVGTNGDQLVVYSRFFIVDADTCHRKNVAGFFHLRVGYSEGPQPLNPP